MALQTAGQVTFLGFDFDCSNHRRRLSGMYRLIRCHRFVFEGRRRRRRHLVLESLSGARRCDSDATVYCYTFGQEPVPEWDWSERYPEQTEDTAPTRD